MPWLIRTNWSPRCQTNLFRARISQFELENLDAELCFHLFFEDKNWYDLLFVFSNNLIHLTFRDDSFLNMKLICWTQKSEEWSTIIHHFKKKLFILCIACGVNRREANRFRTQSQGWTTCFCCKMQEIMMWNVYSNRPIVGPSEVRAYRNF